MNLLYKDSISNSSLTKTLYELSKWDFFNKWLYRKIKPHIKGHLLEIGCGLGNLSKYLIDNDSIKSILLTDVNENYVEYVRKLFSKHKEENIKFDKWDISNPLESNKRFDTIICINVLEHINDESVALQNMIKLLSDDGNLILMVPALPSLYSSLDVAVGHYRRYSLINLQEKLLKNGFLIKFVVYINFFGIIGWFLNGKILKKTILPSSQLQLFNYLSPILLAIEKYFKPPIGLSLLAIAKRGTNNG